MFARVVMRRLITEGTGGGKLFCHAFYQRPSRLRLFWLGSAVAETMRRFQENEIRLLQDLRYELAATGVMLHAIRLRMLVRKANFDPNQPRVPRGNPDGGEWMDGGHSTGKRPASRRDERFPPIRISHDGPPELQHPPHCRTDAGAAG